MPQNFNIKPYNDDFDETKHFYRVLFRPSVAVQARELTQAQTILQQQIKYLGDSIYKHGSMVIPGQVATDAKTNYVRLKATYGMLGDDPIPINLELFTSKIVQGQTSGLQAQVVHYTEAVNNDSPTLFVKYMNTGRNGETVFPAGEILTLVNSATGLAEVEDSDATGLSISAQIDEGVYYVWGFFVRVESQYLLLNKYTNIVSTRVGLSIVESIITPEDDASLTDNAQGSTNYAAPGAHRYKIDLILTSKDLDDTSNDENFIELVRLVNSMTQRKVVNDTYSVLAKELAQRMADTNGDFAVRNFALDVREHLDTSFVTEGTAAGASVATVSPDNPAKLVLDTNASAVNDTYNGMELYINNGPGAGQIFQIVDYVGSTKTAILDDDYVANKVPDTTSTYVISDPSKVNRGVYPPSPFGIGDAAKLAVGLESGRAYVDGYRIDTLATTYVDVDKARDYAQAANSLIPTPVGNYILVKNLFNIPLPAATAFKDFLTINFSNIKASGSFNESQNGIGTARVHGMEFFKGTNAASSDAIFKLYLFDVKMNAGQNINNARSFFLTNEITHNNNGNSLDAYGDICTTFTVANVNGTGLVNATASTSGPTITGPSSIGTEVLVLYDPINSTIITEPNGTNGTQILNSGTFTVSGGTSGVLGARRQIFQTSLSTLVYPLSQKLIKTVRDSGNSVRTSYYIRQMFEAQRNGSGQYIFNSVPNAPFASFSGADYAACVVSSSNSAEIGKFIDLSSYINAGSFSGSPANTTLTFSILSGLGSTSGTIIKLMATVYKTAASEKLKALTSTSIAYPNPTTVMSLQKSDIVMIDSIIDSGNPGVDADEGNPTHIDIKSRYAFDPGQRDYFYDIGKVILRPGQPSPAGRVKIFFKYFSHSGSGDYFSVDSYLNQVDYDKIPVYAASNGLFYSLRDCLDFRPRKDDLNFGFSGTGSSFSNPLSPNNTVVTDFQYYLGRTDKIYVDQYGNFNVIKGTSGLRPLAPPDPLDGMMLYTLKLNPYTLSPNDMQIKATKNPRYTMHDIGKLEDRIANLEYYTNLSQLEQKTATFQITDTKTGIDRFKNGFVVDNFTGHSVGNVFDPSYKCAIDPDSGMLRPTFIQDVNTLVFNANASSGYVWNAGLLCKTYLPVITIEQKFATTITNINPFAVFSYHGEIILNPPTDTWKDTVQRPVINVTDNSAMDGYRFVNQWSGTTWGDWQTSWVGVPESTSTTTTDTVVSNGGAGGGLLTGQARDAAIQEIIANDPQHWVWGGAFGGPADIIHLEGRAWSTVPEWAGQEGTDIVIRGAGGSTTTAVTTTTTVNTTQQVGQTRAGTQTRVTSQVTQRINNALVDTSLSSYIRSRRIKIIGLHFKPETRLYPFFDGVDVSAYCRPFSDPSVTPGLDQATWEEMEITWGGDFNPQLNRNQGTTEDTGDTGETATYSVGALNDAIYTDGVGTTTLFFEIPCTDVNKFRVGARPFRLTSSPGNKEDADSFGDAMYNASGIINQYQETITSIYTPRIETRQVSDSRVITQNLGSTTTTSTETTENGGGEIRITLWADPLAQSFLVKEKGGCYCTKIDVYFATADESVPVTMQIRSMVNGYPSQEILPFAEKTLYPGNPDLSALRTARALPNSPEYFAYDPVWDAEVIKTSDDASVPTSFVFDAPVYLNDGVEYAFVLIADSIKYNVYTAKLGGTVVGSTNIVSTPPYLGNLFKSQNASTWVADPSQNMKFGIYKAQFDPQTTGEIYFTNSAVQADILRSLPFQTVNGSNTVRVLHENHRMPKGQYVNSVVTISNVAPGTYNGLTDVQLTGTFSIDNVDLDSYTIEVPGAAALATGRVGPDSVIATKNQQYDSICPVVNSLTPSGTTIDWYMKTTTGKSPHNNAFTAQEPYIKDSAWIPIGINTTTNFLAPAMIASPINETTSIVGATEFDRKSFVMKGVLRTDNANLSPMVDVTRTSIVMANNRIDDPTFANFTQEEMDKGITVTSTSTDYLTFDCQVIVNVIAVTGGNYVNGQTVYGAKSGATGLVVSWDSVNLTLSNVTGVFQRDEAISNGDTVVGTVEKFEYLNTITNPTGILDFSVFIPGYSLVIEGSPSNQYEFDSPVVILSVKGNQIVVDTGDNEPFTPATNQANVNLTQYVRYVAETGPNNCTTASRYITRQFKLAQPANSLRVLFTINRPPGSFVDCYYRILKEDSTQAFETILWKELELDDTVDSGVSSNLNEFKEYVYTANNIGSFTAFSIKLVMRGGNSSLVPRVKDFRGIALAT